MCSLHSCKAAMSSEAGPPATDKHGFTRMFHNVLRRHRRTLACHQSTGNQEIPSHNSRCIHQVPRSLSPNEPTSRASYPSTCHPFLSPYRVGMIFVTDHSTQYTVHICFECLLALLKHLNLTQLGQKNALNHADINQRSDAPGRCASRPVVSICSWGIRRSLLYTNGQSTSLASLYGIWTTHSHPYPVSIRSQIQGWTLSNTRPYMWVKGSSE